MNDDAEKSSEAMLAAVEAVLTETRQTVEALTVSALQQAHAASHRADLTAESSFQAHKDMTVTTKERARNSSTSWSPARLQAAVNQPAAKRFFVAIEAPLSRECGAPPREREARRRTH